MRLSKFVLDATMCSGRVQRMLSEDGIENIMDELALHEVHGFEETARINRFYDVKRLGVTTGGELRVEIKQRMTVDRILWGTLRGLLGLAALIGIVALVWSLAFNAGQASLSVQLPTL